MGSSFSALILLRALPGKNASDRYMSRGWTNIKDDHLMTATHEPAELEEFAVGHGIRLAGLSNQPFAIVCAKIILDAR